MCTRETYIVKIEECGHWGWRGKWECRTNRRWESYWDPQSCEADKNDTKWHYAGIDRLIKSERLQKNDLWGKMQVARTLHNAVHHVAQAALEILSKKVGEAKTTVEMLASFECGRQQKPKRTH